MNSQIKLANKRVGVVILNWNNYADLVETIEAVYTNRRLYSEIDVLVVDSGSIDRSTNKVQKKYPNNKYIYIKKNVGFAKGNNVGIKYFLKKSYPYIFLLNNDISLEESCIAKLVAELETNSRCAMVGPRIYSYDNRDKFQLTSGELDIWKAKPISKWAYEKEKLRHPTKRNVNKLPGCALLIKKSVFENLGILDERFFLYYSDTDFQKRVIDAGMEIISVDSVSAYHKISKSTSKNMNNTIYYANYDFLNYVSKVYKFHIVAYNLVNSYIRRFFYYKNFKNKTTGTKPLKYLTKAYIDFLLERLFKYRKVLFT